MYKEYLSLLGNIPDFLNEYLTIFSLARLKKVGYFCGMDYASKDIYNFLEYISRFDHSVSTALLTYKLTKNKKKTLAALFHDIATPCFSHVIDYMNKDYLKQESTELATYNILKNDSELRKLLKKDNLTLNDVYYKNYCLVDNKRPKLCTDRLDGIILTSMFWTKDLTINEVDAILKNICLCINEDKEEEIGFKNEKIAKMVYEVNNNIDLYCHSLEDNYMMEFLAQITKLAIKKKIIKYKDLYSLNEEELLIKMNKNKTIKELLIKFQNIKNTEIEEVDLPMIKKRIINPWVNKERLIKE